MALFSLFLGAGPVPVVKVKPQRAAKSPFRRLFSGALRTDRNNGLLSITGEHKIPTSPAYIPVVSDPEAPPEIEDCVFSEVDLSNPDVVFTIAKSLVPHNQKEMIADAILRLLEMAESSKNTGNLTEAQRVFDMVKELDPGNPYFINEIAQVYVKTSDMPDAYLELGSACINEALNDRSDSKRRKELMAEGLKAFSRAVELDFSVLAYSLLDDVTLPELRKKIAVPENLISFEGSKNENLFVDETQLQFYSEALEKESLDGMSYIEKLIEYLECYKGENRGLAFVLVSEIYGKLGGKEIAAQRLKTSAELYKKSCKNKEAAILYAKAGRAYLELPTDVFRDEVVRCLEIIEGIETDNSYVADSVKLIGRVFRYQDIQRDIDSCFRLLRAANDVPGIKAFFEAFAFLDERCHLLDEEFYARYSDEDMKLADTYKGRLLLDSYLGLQSNINKKENLLADLMKNEESDFTAEIEAATLELSPDELESYNEEEAGEEYDADGVDEEVSGEEDFAEAVDGESSPTWDAEGYVPGPNDPRRNREDT
ncbi:hypothetical protein A3J90_02310 [candidate division WOR-1 bacterium RIFOXYC2_FULL_37_10]|uniref:Uncharacterized protein n=1 Tax=candidate division WOR-1 bacterium RIFOXYB2_FULL_37_13 TaxID=1802579 RepID=A0A1F4SP95_UNCSA|nr:MAG: hypothetical protein A2246_04830 [candidate division WOR-1 bacterium RIFOXYA2_FULL_37_7]OGC22177.1 MAG: hypothetical protein A2310_05000 [candidate division WOR-1 bacterium RIFOXYB2_FULL_37_13]OGC37087.1 MAG: hypothetical protein A3J90_02310 [candidate division WOR-1 bacterium RIFOXYC2_FULL_37_10]